MGTQAHDFLARVLYSATERKLQLLYTKEQKKERQFAMSKGAFPFLTTH